MTSKQLIDVLDIALKSALANVHTAVIAVVTKVDTATINVRPVINRVVNGESIELPEFIEVPPLFMQGGTSYTAYPIAIGDYCLLIISERCFDRWYSGQDFANPAELRMHDYSDAIALVGINPLISAIEIPSTIKEVGNKEYIGNLVQTGDVIHEGDYDITGNFDQEGDMTIIGDLDLTGNLIITGNILCAGNIAAASFSGVAGAAMSSTVDFETSGEVIADGKSLSTHTHDYTWTDPGGSGTTATPN